MRKAVERFPEELRARVRQAWTRNKCAPCRCNDLTGMLELTFTGRLAVRFTPPSAAPGTAPSARTVADFLREAGEERAKKWRRLMRMPGYGQAPGKEMTAEHFLVIVGYEVPHYES